MQKRALAEKGRECGEGVSSVVAAAQQLAAGRGQRRGQRAGAVDEAQLVQHQRGGGRGLGAVGALLLACCLLLLEAVGCQQALHQHVVEQAILLCKLFCKEHLLPHSAFFCSRWFLPLRDSPIWTCDGTFRQNTWEISKISRTSQSRRSIWFIQFSSNSYLAK